MAAELGNGEVPLARNPLVRLLYLSLACVCIVVAGIGVIVPGLPSTEFVLLAAWAASRSSTRLYAWLLANPVLGPVLRDWQSGKGIRTPYKILSSTMMLLALVVMAWRVEHWPSVMATAAILLLVSIWIWRRPNPANE